MKPNPRFLNLPKHFWANVRTLSETIGYTEKGQIKTSRFSEMKNALRKVGLDSAHILDIHDRPTPFGALLHKYFAYRANVLNRFAEPHLMDVQQAKQEFERLQAKYRPQCPIPLNKQTGDKKAPAYFTGIINTLIEANARGLPCNYSPRKLTTVTRDGAPLRTLARQVDGAFPSVVNPIAVWEIKEYYYTTTFGSRVADGVYETLLDGMELEELRAREHIHVKHYLMIDAHYTWWECGRSYLCRLIDMLHMGYVDQVLFGYEVIKRLPPIVKEWASLARRRQLSGR